MYQELYILAGTAATIGFIHTLIGPDHYIPFIAMAKSGRWSLKKTTWVTVFCGIGHVVGSVLLGLFGIGFGITLSRIEGLESVRGDIATWGLIAFGLVYFAWGIRHTFRQTTHNHIHTHGNGEVHTHEHSHSGKHSHLHANHENSVNITPWVLFIIFVMGPCEPLIPILMYPAAQESLYGVILVTVIFAAATILTMVTMVLIGLWGLRFSLLSGMEKYSHAFAGASLSLCGLAILTLGV